MSDIPPRHDATRRDEFHTMTLKELEARIAAAGILMSRRQIQRHCKSGTFDAQRLPAANNVEEWFIAPTSVERGIADIQALQQSRARRDATGRDRSGSDATEKPGNIDSDATRQVASRRDMTDTKNSDDREQEPPATSRQVATELDIFQHPYVLKLEASVEKWQQEYKAQVRRTEDIQLQSQEKILELQRMTSIGQSKTLADFMLQAKNMLFGSPGIPAESGDGKDQPVS